MALPEINVWSVDKDIIYLNWQVSHDDQIVKYNLYGSATYDGSYTPVQEMIPNHPHPITPGAVLAKILRTDLSIAPDQPYFFKITSLDGEGTESDIADSNFVAVDALDDIFKERLVDNFNPVYKSIIVTADTDTFVDVERILGRKANFAIVRSDSDITLKFNSSTNDPVSVTGGVPLQFDRQSIVISSVYLTGSGSVELFVSGL